MILLPFDSALPTLIETQQCQARSLRDRSRPAALSLEVKPIDQLIGFSLTPNHGLGPPLGRLSGDHPPGAPGRTTERKTEGPG